MIRWQGPRLKVSAMPDAVARLDRIGAAVAAKARKLAPVRTGALRESIRHRVRGGVQVASVEVVCTVPYAEFQESGTATIAPRRFLANAVEETRGKTQGIIDAGSRAAARTAGKRGVRPGAKPAVVPKVPGSEAIRASPPPSAAAKRKPINK